MHILDTLPDTPDQRDWLYRPTLGPLPAKIDPARAPWWSALRVRDQKREPSCTGHALASVIDHLLAQRAEDQDAAPLLPHGAGGAVPWASAHMLYKNAQFHDEWEGESYSGSSLRGVIKGFYHNGVCSIALERELRDKFDDHSSNKVRPWFANHDLVSNARQVQLGAYYRVQPRLTDTHSALAETGILLASAGVHAGWYDTIGQDNLIRFDGEKHGEADKVTLPRHAFVIVGYDKESFWVQNSWGTSWGNEGWARWSYADWSQNILDTWVVQLAAPVSDAFRLSAGLKGVSSRPSNVDSELAGSDNSRSTGPTRLDVLGHMVPVENGRIKRFGRYHHDPQTLESTLYIVGHRLEKKAQERHGALFAPDVRKMPTEDFWYQHIHIQFLGGWRDEITTARHVLKLQEIYKANRIYPLFFYWEPGTYGEIYQLLRRVIDDANRQTETGSENRFDQRERLIESKLASMGRRLTVEMHQASSRFFFELAEDSDDRAIWRRTAGEGIQFFDSMFEKLSWRFRNRSMSYHLTAHGFGAWIILKFFQSQDLLERRSVFNTVNLISPAIDWREFEAYLAPYLTADTDGPVNRAAKLPHNLIENVNLWYNSAEDDRYDTFVDSYRGSWPQLWSRVIGTIERNRTWEDARVRRPLPDLALHKELGENYYVARLLNIAEFALAAKDVAEQRGWPVNVRAVERTGNATKRTTHFGMDLTTDMVRQILPQLLAADNSKPPISTRSHQGILA